MKNYEDGAYVLNKTCLALKFYTYFTLCLVFLCFWALMYTGKRRTHYIVRYVKLLIHVGLMTRALLACVHADEAYCVYLRNDDRQILDRYEDLMTLPNRAYALLFGIILQPRIHDEFKRYIELIEQFEQFEK